MNSKLLTIAAGALLVACSAAAAADTYKITASMPDEFDGLTAYLVNFDTGEKMDSAVIADSRALFNGTVAQPALARLIVDGNRMGSLIVEPGDITVDKGRVSGTPLNKINADMQAYSRQLGERFRALPDDSTSVAAQQAIMAEYEAYTDSLFKANVNNPVGYALFIDMAYSLSLDELQDMLKQYPVLKQYKRVEKLLAAAVNKQATQPGNKFMDFTIQNDSVKQSLSDYVGKGKPVLVDFWASWCGPCRMVSPVLDEIAEERQDIKVGKINVDEQPELAARFGVMSIPTLVVMKDGRIVNQMVGARPKAQILSML